MSEEAKTELKLPKKYKRPTFKEFKATRGYEDFDEEEYVSFFENYEARLSEQYLAGEVTDDDMTDADGDGLPDILHVRSQVRAQANRTQRARHPTRHRFKQYLFGDPSKRLVRKRPLRLPANDVRKNLDELIAKEAAGILTVHAPNGQRVDLKALKAGRVELAPAPAPAPLVNKPLDSAANDVPAGEHMSQFQGGTFAGDPIAAEVGARLASEKQAEAEKKEPVVVNKEPAATSTEPGADPADGAPSTELEQPPTGVDGAPAPIVDQLPKDSEASVEAPAAPLAATELATPPAVEEPSAEEQKHSLSKKSGKKGGGK